jgi:hypothetical protein
LLRLWAIANPAIAAVTDVVLGEKVLLVQIPAGAVGQADLYTFNTLEEAARFGKAKIEALMAIERSIDTKPADAAGPLKITPIAVANPGRRRKRA